MLVQVVIGHVRVHCCCAGVNKYHFVPDLVGPLLEVTLVPEEELRKATLPVLFDMMLCDIKVNGHCKQVRAVTSRKQVPGS